LLQSGSSGGGLPSGRSADSVERSRILGLPFAELQGSLALLKNSLPRPEWIVLACRPGL